MVLVIFEEDDEACRRDNGEMSARGDEAARCVGDEIARFIDDGHVGNARGQSQSGSEESASRQNYRRWV